VKMDNGRRHDEDCILVSDWQGVDDLSVLGMSSNVDILVAIR
jgi:hypothetical protein